MNRLYYGDNLDIMRRYIDKESVDLVYLDPPFNSSRNYNVIFEQNSDDTAGAQIKAFEDTWHWDHIAAVAFKEIVEAGGQTSEVMRAFRSFLGESDMMAYLVMMAPRLVELRRCLKATGCLFLHCDPTACHYLKILLDAIFGKEMFRNEIVWRRTGSHGKVKRFGPLHDIILFYSKSNNYQWKFLKKPYMKGHVEENFVKVGKRYRTNYYGNVLTGSGLRGGESGKIWKGFNPSAKGRHWAVPGALIQDLDEDLSGLTQHQKLDRLLEMGFIKIIEGQAWPIYERFITETDGQAIGDIWAFQPYTNGTVFNTDECIDEDVRWLSPQDQERLGYPTQKPEGLLSRIINSCTKNEDIVLDPFCGCGTTISVAQKLKRQWIGIDITHLAITLMKTRLRDTFGESIKSEYKVVGEPVDLAGARELAKTDPYQFQWWALGLVGARPVEQKKGADKGIDGRLTFHDDKTGKTRQVIFSVKAGQVHSSHIRDLAGVLEREKAEMGALITMEPPTRNMVREASAADLYVSQDMRKTYPKIQILTIEELLKGKKPEMPYFGTVTFKKAEKFERKDAEQEELF
jgi:site-specific DNA-methyltransferase (adenine-specific)